MAKEFCEYLRKNPKTGSFLCVRNGQERVRLKLTLSPKILPVVDRSCPRFENLICDKNCQKIPQELITKPGELIGGPSIRITLTSEQIASGLLPPMESPRIG